MSGTGDLFAQPQMPQPARVRAASKPGGVAAEHQRLWNQRKLVARNAKHGPPTGKLSIDERFMAFHNRNPRVYAELVEMAFQLKLKGHTRYSIQGLIEVIRFKFAIATDADDFKINNDFASRYARLLMENNSSLAGFFEPRALKSL